MHRAHRAGRGVAHKGFVGFEIETAGRAAHGSRPEPGSTRSRTWARCSSSSRALAGRLRPEPHPLLGAGSLHASLIEGGQEFSSYPERCLLPESGARFRVRAAPTSRPSFARWSRAAASTPSYGSLPGDPFEVGEANEIVRLVHGHAGTAIIGVPYWADSAPLAAAGIPTVLFGPRGGGEHAVVEWVDLDSVEKLFDVLLAVAQDFCRIGSVE